MGSGRPKLKTKCKGEVMSKPESEGSYRHDCCVGQYVHIPSASIENIWDASASKMTKVKRVEI